ncbi:MAG: polyhydroxyalkanoic acid system family protein, partial [Bdellovibrionales bacterium]|nr:polyhydroxyalkanoic acid system family protein [Bdellovibrionales bacterium]
EIEGGNFKGSIRVTEGKDRCTVEIVVDLPLLLTPFKGKVEEELEKHLSRVEV